jgi:hypothetical protein
MAHNRFTGGNAGGPHQREMGTRYAARVAQFCRWATMRTSHKTGMTLIELPFVLMFLIIGMVGENWGKLGTATYYMLIGTIAISPNHTAP